jgi:DNA modification methylase
MFTNREDALKSLFAIPESARNELLARFTDRVEINPSLSRALVSYQSNRRRASYRWFKYKEGFSAALVEYLISTLDISTGTLLDPFAGSGAALFVASEPGLASIGIELLPVGIVATKARIAAINVPVAKLREAISKIESGQWRIPADPALSFKHLRITQGAFPDATELALSQYRTYLRDTIKSDEVRSILDFACLTILESISFTRKDGQYLRWDSRAPRKLPGKTFNKGQIHEFETALLSRLHEIAEDLSEPKLFQSIQKTKLPKLELHQGSCLDLLPMLLSNSCDAVITSPPYCNRYDYTRTYALELAYLGVDENQLKGLRQSLLSCTVENRSKLDALHAMYTANRANDRFKAAIHAFENQDALQEVLAILERKGARGELNNANVPRMVRNYFLESAVTIFEWARILKPGGKVALINDNVRYSGEEIPVDLILSDFAERAGFSTEHIWILGRGKGNSSQQMGAHGRQELRKCVYTWRRD